MLNKLPLNPVEAQKYVERQGKLTQIVNQIKGQGSIFNKYNQALRVASWFKSWDPIYYIII